MAKIIRLGCEVADVYRRYTVVHSDLFSASALRLLKNALTGKGRLAYADYRHTLAELLALLEDLERRIVGCDRSDLSFRRAEELQEIMLKYTAALAKVIAGLAGICNNLAQDEQGYREVDTAGQSRFNQDKVSYDYALSELENLGNKLNRLFSSY